MDSDEKVLDSIKPVVEYVFGKDKKLDSLFLLFDKNGNLIPISDTLLSLVMSSYENRSLFTSIVSILAWNVGARYVGFVSEMWYAVQNADEQITARPSERADRKEGVMVTVTDLYEREAICSIAEIDRSGSVPVLSKWEQNQVSQGALVEGFIKNYQFRSDDELGKPVGQSVEKITVPIIE